MGPVKTSRMSVASSNGDCDAAGDVDSDQDGLSDAVDDDDDNDGIPDNRKCHSRRCLDIHIIYTDEICVDILIFYPMFPLTMLLQATIIRNYFVKTQTYVASFGPPDLSIIF